MNMPGETPRNFGEIVPPDPQTDKMVEEMQNAPAPAFFEELGKDRTAPADHLLPPTTTTRPMPTTTTTESYPPTTSPPHSRTSTIPLTTQNPTEAALTAERARRQAVQEEVEKPRPGSAL